MTAPAWASALPTVAGVYDVRRVGQHAQVFRVRYPEVGVYQHSTGDYPKYEVVGGPPGDWVAPGSIFNLEWSGPLEQPR